MAKEHYLRKELYQLVRDDSAIFDFLQAGSLDGIWYWDLQKPEHEWMSPAFWRTLGYDPEQRQHLAAEWQDLIHPDDLTHAVENFNKHCEDASHPYDQYVRYRHKKGHWVWVRCRGVAIRDADGTPIRMLGVHVDITDLKNSEQRQRELLAEKEQVNDELRLFAYAASHDLQSPIKSLSGLIGLLKLELADGGRPSERIVDNITKSVDRMQSLIDSILVMSNLENTEIAKATVALPPLVEEILESLPLPENAEVIQDNLDVVYANRPLLSRALQNFLANSIVHRSSDRPLRIRIGQVDTDDSNELFVEDNGLGIAEGREQMLFDMFSRDRGNGHGLGLSIVKRVAEHHNGTVRATRIPVGARFSLTLPSEGDNNERRPTDRIN